MSLDEDEYSRYGRQMQVPAFNALSGQIGLKQSKILVVGCGGLGSSALLYLAASGVGCIGVLDHDRVELSNLHRQIIHETSTIGMLKTESACQRIKALNQNITVNIHSLFLSNQNAYNIFQKYDLILDCTDNPITKYLISDTCVASKKPLVSASSVKTDGQLMILNYQNGPCYRCIHPKPTKPENIATCSDDGVIGPCVGLVGTLMSIESIKILTNYYNKETNPFKPIMLMYSGYMANDGQMLKSFKMRGKMLNCLCGKMNKEMIQNINYTQFCGKIDYDVLNNTHSIDFAKLSALENPVMVDVRPKEQFAISNLGDQENFKVINIPYTSLIRLDDESLEELLPKDSPIVAVCKMGNDSRLSTKYLLDKGFEVYDLKGGLNEYSKTHDFHVYW